MHKDLQPTRIKFIYPLIDKRVTPAKHFTDLNITADIKLDRHTKAILGITIVRISFFSKGESFSSNIDGLLQLVNSDLHQEIYEATENHAKSNDFVKATDTVTIKFINKNDLLQ